MVVLSACELWLHTNLKFGAVETTYASPVRTHGGLIGVGSAVDPQVWYEIGIVPRVICAVLSLSSTTHLYARFLGLSDSGRNTDNMSLAIIITPNHFGPMCTTV
ncbi:hypothetical protein FA13DRAFT_1731366, partial [Coprinellus micaceus]